MNRRSFLKRAGAAALIVVAAPLFVPSERLELGVPKLIVPPPRRGPITLAEGAEMHADDKVEQALFAEFERMSPVLERMPFSPVQFATQLSFDEESSDATGTIYAVRFDAVGEVAPRHGLVEPRQAGYEIGRAIGWSHEQAKALGDRWSQERPEYRWIRERGGLTPIPAVIADGANT